MCYCLHVCFHLDKEDFVSELNISSIVMMGSEMKKCTNIIIVDDKTVEMIESFEFIITIPPGQEAIDSGEIVPAAMQLNGIINIIDDDGELIQNEGVWSVYMLYLSVLTITSYLAQI